MNVLGGVFLNSRKDGRKDFIYELEKNLRS